MLGPPDLLQRNPFAGLSISSAFGFTQLIRGRQDQSGVENGEGSEGASILNSLGGQARTVFHSRADGLKRLED